jgi:2-polyprenyl-6-methoxyphenol hydroxylase-like FAD-dependent oxidoreductase
VPLEHVVVLGAGIAGLAVTGVLARRGVRVTLVERDHLDAAGRAGAGGSAEPRTPPAAIPTPPPPAPRPGTPQARHVHALLTRGRQELEAIFPGLTAELLTAGALELDWTTQPFRTVMGWLPRFDSGLRSAFCSRSLLEETVRRRVLALPGVELLDGREVVGLIGDARQVTGARMRLRRAGRPADGEGADGERGHPSPHDHGASVVSADLVIDATGRGSLAPRWLAELGHPAPQETVVASQLAYASRLYARPKEWRSDWLLLASRQSPPSTRATVLYPVEGGRWFVTLAGQGGEVPPHDEPGFLAYARSVDGVDDALDDAEPLDRIATYRRTDNRWRHWERRRRPPDGFLLVGDAMCCFNPVYGQGMTVAAMQANRLGRFLDQREWRPGSVHRFQRIAARLLRDPWTLATQEDFRSPGTTGRRSRMTRLTHAYTDEVLRAAVHDQVVAKRFIEVAQLMRPASDLAEPAILARVLRLRRARRASHRATRGVEMPVGGADEAVRAPHAP